MVPTEPVDEEQGGGFFALPDHRGHEIPVLGAPSAQHEPMSEGFPPGYRSRGRARCACHLLVHLGRVGSESLAPLQAGDRGQLLRGEFES